jgi:hypothetical protein
MFWVLVGSVIDGWSRLDSCTGSTAETRASDRASRTGSLCFDDVEFDDRYRAAVHQVVALSKN